MPATPEQLYKAHVRNLRAVDAAFERVIRELNASLARSDEKTSDALLKTAMLLLGGWAENRLRKLTYEPNGFSPAERKKIHSANTQLDSWTTALELGFRRRHAIPHAALAVALPLTPRAHYGALTAVFDADLRPIIEVRNKLAHGQWSRALNADNTDFSTVHNQQINNENAHSVKCKHRILENMAQLIHDLVAGNHAFARDFDKHFLKLEMAQRDITSRAYGDWLAQMRKKFDRGKTKRALAYKAVQDSAAVIGVVT
jgi:hypothetical protein